MKVTCYIIFANLDYLLDLTTVGVLLTSVVCAVNTG
jgi:hypothetical protein